MANVLGDKDANVKKSKDFLAKALDDNADLVVFPELFTEGSDDSATEDLTEAKTEKLGSIWFIRRVLVTEAPFYANELASIGLILGAILSWFLNPMHPAYGSGLFPAILLSQMLTVAIGILLYYDSWGKMGWYPNIRSLGQCCASGCFNI